MAADTGLARTQISRAFRARSGCRDSESGLELGSTRSCQFWWHTPGTSLGVPLGSKRLSSSKGQTRRETGTQSHGPPALSWWSPGRRRDGQAKSPSVPEPTPLVSSSPQIRGPATLVTSRLVLLFLVPCSGPEPRPPSKSRYGL